MKLTVTIDGVERRLDPETESARVLDLATCPRCGYKPHPERGVRVQGKGKRITGHDVYEADGYAACCGQPLGTIRAVVSTVFGVEEDERVLYHGRCRVY